MTSVLAMVSSRSSAYLRSGPPRARRRRRSIPRPGPWCARPFRRPSASEWPRVSRLVALVEDPLPAKTAALAAHGPGRPAGATSRRSRGFLIDNPDWPWPEQLQLLAEGTITDPADHALIRRLFADRAPLTTRGHIRYAEALFQIDEDERAEALIRSAWIEGDFSEREEKALLRQVPAHPDPRGPHRPARQPPLGLPPPVGRTGCSSWCRTGTAGWPRPGCALQRRQSGLDEAIEAVPASLRSDPGLPFDRLRWRRQHRLDQGVDRAAARPSRRRSADRRSGGSSASCRSAGPCASGTSISPTGWPAGHRQTEGRRLRRSGMAGRLAGAAFRRAAERGAAPFRAAVPWRPGAGRPWRAPPIGRAAARWRLAIRCWPRSGTGAAAAHPIAYYGQLAAESSARPRRRCPTRPGGAPRMRAAFRAQGAGARRSHADRGRRHRRGWRRSWSASASWRPARARSASSPSWRRAAGARIWSPRSAGIPPIMACPIMPPRFRSPISTRLLRPAAGDPEPALLHGRGPPGEPVQSLGHQPRRRAAACCS